MMATDSVLKTPLQACLTYKGYGFAWFYDSNLAMIVANNLASAGLVQGINVYHDFKLDDLHIASLWQYYKVGNSAIFLQYHRSYKVSEVHEMGKIISETIKQYNYEKGDY